MIPLAPLTRRLRPKPAHLFQGADRAGLASALWLLDKEGAEIEVARKMLSFRFVHLKHTKTGLMDHVLDCYEHDCQLSPMTIRDWFKSHYDHEALTASFYAKKGWSLPS